MERNHYNPAQYDENAYMLHSQDRADASLLSQPTRAQDAYSQPDRLHTSTQPPVFAQQNNGRIAEPVEVSPQYGSKITRRVKIDEKWQRRLYWMVPLIILVIALCVLFEVYKSDFERWARPLTNWLHEREAWSWVIPTIILVLLSFPPLFGHEIVQLLVGLTYPLGVAVGIACAGAILGEAACFVVFKYVFTSWTAKRIATRIKWAAIARVTQQAGFKGVLVLRYSIVPPHLANPLFACTGMPFWLYMITVILSLPKSIVFVILGTPSSEHSKGAKYGKVIAVLVLVVVTIFASWWIRTRLKIATAEIEAERGVSQNAEFTTK